MRGHIGYHIIKLEKESSVCGFCGLPSCTNKLMQSSKKSKNKFFKIESNCDFFPMDINLFTLNGKNAIIT